MNLDAKLAKIASLKSELAMLQPIDAALEKRIFQKLSLDWNFHSNAIEGNTLTFGETMLFLQQGLTAGGKPFRDYLNLRGHNEAIGCIDALARQKAPITAGMIDYLRHTLFIGPHRTGAMIPNGITPGRNPDGASEAASETSARLEELLKWYRDSLAAKNADPVSIAAIFHHRLIAIHPSDAGDARLARLMMNLTLMQSGLPPAIIRVQNHHAYLRALRNADQGDPEPITSMVADEAIHSLELYLKGARGESIDELDQVDKEILILNQQLSRVEAPIEWTPAFQEHFLEQAMKPLLEKMIAKLSQFDDFYSESEIKAGAQYMKESARHGWSPPAGTRNRDIAAHIVTLHAMGLLENIQVTFRWRGFKKIRLKNFDDQVHFILQFQKMKYSMNAGGLASEHLYQHPLDEREIGELVSHMCKGRITAIQKHTGVE